MVSELYNSCPGRTDRDLNIAGMRRIPLSGILRTRAVLRKMSE